MREVVAPSWVLSGTLTEALAAFATAGIKLLEITSTAEPPGPDLRDPQQLAELRQALVATGQQVHSVHSEFGVNWDLAAAEEAARREAVANHATVIKAAAELGVRHVVIHPGTEISPGEPVADQLQRAEQSFRELIPLTAEADLLIAVENLPPDQLGSSLGQIQMLLDSLDPKVVGYCCDTGHAQLGEDSPASYIRALGDRLIGIHWQDNYGTNDDHLFPGLGCIDWEDFFAALGEVGYELPVTVEAPPPPDLPLAEAADIARQSLTHLQPPRIPEYLRANHS